MDMSLFQQMAQYYQLSMGALIGASILAFVLVTLLLSVLSMMCAKILQAKHSSFGAAILVVLSYFVLFIILNLACQLLSKEILYSQFFDLVILVISFIIYSLLCSCFFKTSFVKGMVITLISTLLLIALTFVLAVINR